MTDFKINEYGVVTNPHKAEWGTYGKITYTIETAELNGRWYFGYSLDMPAAGSGRPCDSLGVDYDTEKDAIRGCLGSIRRFIEGEAHRHEACWQPLIRQAIAHIDSEINKHKQLTLFNL